MLKMRLFPTMILIFLFIANLYSQKTSVSFKDSKWKINAEAHQIETYKGQQCIHIDRGSAVLPEVQFKNGIIEFDMVLPENRQFSGVWFRWQNETNYEEFYFRPHQSGKADATQYTPVINGMSAWQLYHGDGHSAALTYRFDEWMHVKLVISGDQGEIFVDDMEQPLLHFWDLKHSPEAGGIGFYSARAGIRIANFSYQKMENPRLVSPPKTHPKMEDNTVKSWQVSNTFASKKLEKVYQLGKAQKQGLQWTKLESEFTGTANLSWVNKRDQELNTAFAKITINSDRDQTKKFHFGFSDIAHVYVNGQLWFSGMDSYASRDFRYLGTIGYFDAIYLPLKKGDNEVWFAISEGFGGWGIKARFEDMEGIRVE